MKRASPANPSTAPMSPVQPSAEHAALALRHAAAVMAPMAQWLLRNGVSYPAFADLLKGVFLEAARGELERGGVNPSQSALSMLSGVHRKDVRELGQEPATVVPSPRPTLSSQVFTRWLTDPRYRDPSGKPIPLARAGGPQSFEALCHEFSRDIHPRAVLDELLRLGHVALEGDHVVMLATSFVPSARLDDMTALFSANAADHLAAAVSNITLNAPKYLEQSVFADGLTTESVDSLHQISRQVWANALALMATQAQVRVDQDSAKDGNQRMRFGVYFYSEPVKGGVESPPSSPVQPETKRRSVRTRSKP